MKNIFYRFISWFPSHEGKESLAELYRALNMHGIEFHIKSIADESGVYFIAESTNLPDKFIVTTAKNLVGLDKNIKDAIFTAFQVPAFYCDDKDIRSLLVKDNVLKYATR